MGSLDVSSAKQQFFQLVDAISASHLPSFTIWLDAKLAEYKTIGQLKPDTEYESNEQYPEWIGKALRHNLSFLFPGASQNSTSKKDTTPAESPDVRKRTSESSDIGSERKRRFVRDDTNDASGTDGDSVMIVKAEPGVKGRPDCSRVTETPLPGIQSTFSLSTNAMKEQGNNIPIGQSAAVYFTTSFENVTSSPAAMTPPNQALPSSSPPPTFSDNTDTETKGSCSKTVNFDTASGHLLPLFSPTAVAKKVEASPQLSTPSPGDASVAYAVSSGAGPSSDAEGSEGAGVQVITNETVQGIVAKFHGGKPTHLVTRRDLKKQSNGCFACPICEKETRHLNDYRKHFVSHTSDRPFKCPYCPTCFKTQDTCYAHQLYMHPDNPRIKVTALV